MKFKDIKNLIYTDVTLVLGTKRYFHVMVWNTKEYDDYTVIGIRVDNNFKNCLLISLK